MSDMNEADHAQFSTKHPHEPDIPPALDEEGRCLVCSLLVRLEEAEQTLEWIGQVSSPWILEKVTVAEQEQGVTYFNALDRLEAAERERESIDATLGVAEAEAARLTAERDEALEDAHREHQAVEGWSLRAERLTARLEEVREALEYYGWGAASDGGAKARAALAASSGEPDTQEPQPIGLEGRCVHGTLASVPCPDCGEGPAEEPDPRPW